MPPSSLYPAPSRRLRLAPTAACPAVRPRPPPRPPAPHLLPPPHLRPPAPDPPRLPPLPLCARRPRRRPPPRSLPRQPDPLPRAQSPPRALPPPPQPRSPPYPLPSGLRRHLLQRPSPTKLVAKGSSRVATATTSQAEMTSSAGETRVDNPLPPAEPEPIFNDHPAVEAFSLDHISPVIERLQRLEGKVDELGSKPPEIPLEKERSLLESWDRIKCIESDLERTKKVLQATVMKQLKIDVNRGSDLVKAT